jgi:transcriptional regulator with XRE-family HTH domain
MQSELGELFRRTRVSLGLTLQDLGRRIGYRNLNKGARRLDHLERDGVEAEEFVARAAVALGIDAQQVADTMTSDGVARRAEFDAWLQVPQPMALYGYAVGITFGLPLPEGLTDEQAIAHAVALQRERRVRVCLVLHRRRSLWISLDGAQRLTNASPDHPNIPYTTVR